MPGKLDTLLNVISFNRNMREVGGSSHYSFCELVANIFSLQTSGQTDYVDFHNFQSDLLYELSRKNLS
jgi:hypothetical protein